MTWLYAYGQMETRLKLSNRSRTNCLHDLIVKSAISNGVANWVAFLDICREFQRSIPGSL